jgi:hypothetical protein
MSRKNRIIVRLRQSQALRCVALVVLWIATTASLPLVQVSPSPSSQHEQKILAPDPIPLASPGHQSKSVQEFSGFSAIMLGVGIAEEQHCIYYPLDRRSPEHSRLLAVALVYTQTTSSFL